MEVRTVAVIVPGGEGFTGVVFPGGQVVAEGRVGVVSARSLGVLLAGLPGAEVAWTGSAGGDVEVLERWRALAGAELRGRGAPVRGWLAMWAAAQAVLAA